MLVQLPGQQTCLTASGAMNFPPHAFRLCRCMQAPLGAGGCTPQLAARCRCSVGTTSRPHPTACRLTPCPQSYSVSGQCWLWRSESHRVHHCRPACHGRGHMGQKSTLARRQHGGVRIYSAIQARGSRQHRMRGRTWPATPAYLVRNSSSSCWSSALNCMSAEDLRMVQTGGNARASKAFMAPYKCGYNFTMLLCNMHRWISSMTGTLLICGTYMCSRSGHEATCAFLFFEGTTTGAQSEDNCCCNTGTWLQILSPCLRA